MVEFRRTGCRNSTIDAGNTHSARFARHQPPAAGQRGAMLAELLALVAPPRCALCAGACPARELLCGGCEVRMARLPAQLAPIAGLGLVWSAAPYEGLARDLVAALKFGARLGLASRAATA